MYSRILIAFDGSPTAGAIAPYAGWLAQSLETKAELLIVAPSAARVLRQLSMDVENDMDELSYSHVDAARLEEVHGRLRNRAEVIVERQAQVFREQGIGVTTQVTEGDPADAIIAASQDTPNSLIAIATHGRSGIQRWFVGSVTTKVMREAGCPVLAMRPRGETVAPARSTELVVPLDGSARAETALAHAAELASRLGLPVHLVRAASLSGLGYGFVEDGPTQYADLAGSAQQIARDHLAAVAQDLRSQGIDTVIESVVDGAPDEAIVDAVGPAGDKLVVMTTHGRSGLNRLVLGSVTDRVVRHSAGPVLVVPSLGT